jgi:porphobilinogen synthase
MSNFNYPNFPVSRLRRLRKTSALRDIFRETHLSKNDFIYPLFIVEGGGVKKEIGSMPGQFQMSVDNILRECEELENLGIRSILLFGIPDAKDAVGSNAYHENGIIQKSLREIKQNFPEMLVITDVCLCEYTSHGHCGVVENGSVQNDETLELLAKEALSHAENGADIIAPSDMMDGRVAAIRRKLDENGFTETPIMAYSAKFSSAFYGPFREAAESAPQFGDRKSYQMDFGNSDEAMREIALDIQEGADVVMAVQNDETLELLAKEALSHAENGADIIAPSDMMDGRVAAIRRKLDENGFTETPIMAYSAKFSSAFYGPFREAAESAPQFGDRKSYQMDFGNSDEAMREIALDIQEGADVVMVKPALSYLDLIRRAKDNFNVPIAAYNVSGEYSMIKAAAEKGWLDGERVMLEVLTSIKRAGADVIITYFAKEAAKII